MIKTDTIFRCYICKQYKPKKEFNADRTKRGGVMSKCKSCSILIIKNKDRRGYFKLYGEMNKEKIRAKSLVQYSVKTGRMVRKCCEVCGSDRTEGHHTDYSKPLEVIWLCHKHHMEQHNLQ